eukprot:TRINITY_DN13345_c0_g1_i1.p1 TRINITY_DN13345_c0_g1~~TRINITY_DN13345_c0_g1_i1.p1  ORF type:complete len:487 (-),score=117.51 TRINITY_DN13345_c0_g1_i1:132-1568(-)
MGLDPSISDLDLNQLPSNLRSLVAEKGAQPLFYPLELNYEHLSAEEVLRQVLPSEVEVPTGYETAGHIAHLNLRPEHLPFKSIIGQVILDKNFPRIRSVVNKTSHIVNQFRVFPMELLAGEDNYQTEVRQHGVTFRFDFSQVYWNSRLDTEHARLVSFFQPHHIVCDLFCGIGPFALPAAQKGCRVYANDLNPKSFEYLQSNIVANKLSGRVEAWNDDARAAWLRLRQLQRGGQAPQRIHHIIMNLPMSAVEFLDVFCGSYRQDEVDALKIAAQQPQQPAPPAASAHAPVSKSKEKRKEKHKLRQQQSHQAEAQQHKSEEEEDKFEDVAHEANSESKSEEKSENSKKRGRAEDMVCGLDLAVDNPDGLPRIHCYCFAHKAATSDSILQRVAGVMGCRPSRWFIHPVRLVSPLTSMYCVSFDLTAEAAITPAPDPASRPAAQGEMDAELQEEEGILSKRKMEDGISEGESEQDAKRSKN